MNTSAVAHGDPPDLAKLLLETPQRRRREVPDHGLPPATHRIVEPVQRLDARRALVERQPLVTLAGARKRSLDRIDNSGRHVPLA